MPYPTALRIALIGARAIVRAANSEPLLFSQNGVLCVAFKVSKRVNEATQSLIYGSVMIKIDKTSDKLFLGIEMHRKIRIDKEMSDKA
jgi:hypothetical protein